MLSIEEKILNTFESKIAKRIFDNSKNPYSLDYISSVTAEHSSFIEKLKDIIGSVFIDYHLDEQMVITFDSLRLSINIAIQVHKEKKSNFQYFKSIVIDLSIESELYFIYGLDQVELDRGKKYGLLVFNPVIFPFNHPTHDMLINSLNSEFKKRLDNYQSIDFLTLRKRLPEVDNFLINNELLPLSIYQLIFSDLDLGSLKCIGF